MGAGHGHLVVHGHSPIHRLAPHVKIVAVFAFVCAVAVTPRRAVWVFAVDAAVVVAAFALAGFSVGLVLRRLSVVLPFVAFAFFIPFVAGGPTTDVLGVSLSTEGLWGTFNILAKAVLGTSASLVLAGTTPVPDIVAGLSRLRVPALVTAIIAFMFRYLDVIVDEMARMRTAMVSRGHDARWLWQAKPIASSAGALFVRSYERGERVHAAMLSRGFTGTMPALRSEPTATTAWLGALIAPAVAATAAIVGMVTL